MREELQYYSTEELLALYHRKRKEYPKGVSPKLQSNKYLFLQFIDPTTGLRTARPCNVTFTESGIIQALDKAHKVAKKLSEVTLASDFWDWYELEILGKKEIKNDLRNYACIFSLLEEKYFNGKNKNTKRKRSKDIPNDVASFNSYYGEVFKRFEDINSYPKWFDFEKVLSHWERGTKSFKDAYSVLIKIAKLSHNKDELLSQLEQIDANQTEFRDKQSISLDDFLAWFESEYDKGSQIKKSWLWVSAMCVLYGLRPTEITASKNLTQSITIDKVELLAINNPNNDELLLYLDDFTYFGTSIKTGKRICKPMITDKELIKRLRIQDALIPQYNPRIDSSANSITNGFNSIFRARLKGYNCPVSQIYAFRHLANQLGEMYGIPQEIRSRILGHTPEINERIYKSRDNVQTSIDLLTKHSRQPLSYDLAIEKLSDLSIPLEDNLVKVVLNVIYQL